MGKALRFASPLVGCSAIEFDLAMGIVDTPNGHLPDRGIHSGAAVAATVLRVARLSERC